MTETSDIRRRVSLSLTEISELSRALSEASTELWHHELAERLAGVVTESQDPAYQATVEAYRKAVDVKDGELEIDDDAEVSMGEDPGAYVMAWTWVDAEDAGVCRSCHAVYDGAGDGFDGECPDCADKTEALREIICERCTDKTTMGASPDGNLCPDCYDLVQNTPDEDFVWLNHYRCSVCEAALPDDEPTTDSVDWTMEWSCKCNDRCPTCNTETEPYESEWIGPDGDEG